MSGPKGYSYQVISDEERQRREDEARSRRCDALTADLAAVNTELNERGAPAPKLATRSQEHTHDHLLRWENELIEVLATARQQLKDVRADQLVARLTTRHGVDASHLTLGETTRSLGTQGGGLPSVIAPADLADVTNYIAQVRDPAMRELLTLQTEAVLGNPDGLQAAGDLQTVKTDVMAALRPQGFADLAHAEALTVAGIDTPAADAVRALAAHAATAADVTEVRSRAAAARAEHDRSQDADYVQRALVESLKELGYEVSVGLDVDDLSGNVQVARRDDHPGYGIRFQVNPTTDQLFTRVISDIPASPEADAQVEEETCGDIAAITARLPHHGVRAEKTSDMPPGAAPVDRTATAARSSRRARRTDHRSRRTNAPHGRTT